MTLAFPPFRFFSRKYLPLAFSVLVYFSLASIMRGQTPNSTQATATPGQSQSTDKQADAAAKAAARKRKFEEDKQRLEGNEGQRPASTGDAKQTLFVSPVLVNMLVGDTQRFSLFDIQGHNLTSKAEWSLSNSYVADLTTDGVPTITSKDHGTVTLRARVGSESTEASITVLVGDKLPVGTVRWAAPSIPGYKPTQIIQAVPR